MKIELTQRAIKRALPRLCDALPQYMWLQTQLRRRNVSRDREYQRAFNRFYRVRRGRAWQRVFYHILEGAKSRQPSLSDVLLRLHTDQGKVEASFASKILATINPTMPVIDSVVLRNLGARLPATGQAHSRIEEVAHLHHRIAAVFSNYLRTTQGRRLVAQFRAAYPEAKLTEMKMLDMVLWKTRSAA